MGTGFLCLIWVWVRGFCVRIRLVGFSCVIHRKDFLASQYHVQVGFSCVRIRYGFGILVSDPFLFKSESDVGMVFLCCAVSGFWKGFLMILHVTLFRTGQWCSHLLWSGTETAQEEKWMWLGFSGAEQKQV